VRVIRLSVFDEISSERLNLVTLAFRFGMPLSDLGTETLGNAQVANDQTFFSSGSCPALIP
jgi:hypothetical protein